MFLDSSPKRLHSAGHRLPPIASLDRADVALGLASTRLQPRMRTETGHKGTKRGTKKSVCRAKCYFKLCPQIWNSCLELPGMCSPAPERIFRAFLLNPTQDTNGSARILSEGQRGHRLHPDARNVPACMGLMPPDSPRGRPLPTYSLLKVK